MTPRDPEAERCCEAARSAILATAWLLVRWSVCVVLVSFPTLSNWAMHVAWNKRDWLINWLIRDVWVYREKKADANQLWTYFWIPEISYVSTCTWHDHRLTVTDRPIDGQLAVAFTLCVASRGTKSHWKNVIASTHYHVWGGCNKWSFLLNY